MKHLKWPQSNFSICTNINNITGKISYGVKPKLHDGSIVELVNLSSNGNHSVPALNFLILFLSWGLSIPSSQHGLQERIYLCFFLCERKITLFFEMSTGTCSWSLDKTRWPQLGVKCFALRLSFFEGRLLFNTLKIESYSFSLNPQL